MSWDRNKYRALMSWLSLGLLVILVCALGLLQYRWIGEISQAEQKKLQENLQSSLNEVARDFNSELSRASAALQPADGEVKELGRERAYEARYALWKDSNSHAKLFNRIALVWEENDQLTLRILDSEKGVFLPAEWPAAWNGMKERITSRLRRGPGGLPPGDPWETTDEAALIEIPRFGGFDHDGPRGPGPRRGEHDWLVVEVDPSYATAAVLPELFARHFGQDYQTEYEIALIPRGNPSEVIGDASAAIFDAPIMPGRGGGPGPRRGGGQGAAPPRPSGRAFSPPGGPERGRWRLAVHLKAGSLEAAVAHARWRNLGVSAGILLLLIATGAALLRYSRQAQRLADAEMEFVAGVSHELRTPLTVIRTAAFNLRGKLARDPNQVERYGELIQSESEKLTAIVEQVLRFASAKNGRVIHEREPVSVEDLIDDTLQSSREILEETLCRVDKRIEPAMPPILGDSVALRHAFQNLIGNAVKYGIDGDRWIGIVARTIAEPRGAAIEVRIEDHGPGIPEEEQTHIFDAFFRGKKAVRDQIHGTGLGLNLVKRIVEAHGGTVEIESEPGAGTCFIVRIPTQTPERQDEFAHSLG